MEYEDNQVAPVVDEQLQDVRRRMINELMSAYEVPPNKATKAVDAAIEAGYPIKHYDETNEKFDIAVGTILDKWVQ